MSTSHLPYSVWVANHEIYNKAGEVVSRVMLWGQRYYTKDEWENRASVSFESFPKDQDLSNQGLRAKRLPDDQIKLEE